MTGGQVRVLHIASYGILFGVAFHALLGDWAVVPAFGMVVVSDLAWRAVVRKGERGTR